MKVIIPLFAALLLAGCHSFGDKEADTKSSGTKRAHAQLESKSGSKAKGTAHLTQRDGGKVRVEVAASGLKPNTEHAIHLHEKGDCSAPDATSAGPHFNPEKQPHGHPKDMKRHAGDLPNLRANAQGEVDTTFEVTGITLDEDYRGVLERAIVIHANADDYQTQPAGDAGGRIACGVIRKD